MSGFARGSALPGGIRMSLDRIFPPADVSVFFFVLPRVRDRSRSLNAHLPWVGARCECIHLDPSSIVPNLPGTAELESFLAK